MKLHKQKEAFNMLAEKINTLFEEEEADFAAVTMLITHNGKGGCAVFGKVSTNTMRLLIGRLEELKYRLMDNLMEDVKVFDSRSDNDEE